MNNLLSILMLLLFFSACKSDKEKSNEKFVTLVENADIKNFLNIEYIVNGELETFKYFKSDTVYTSWEYNNHSKDFANYDMSKLYKISSSPLKYIQLLRNIIKGLNVNLISQTLWHGQVIKFWVGDTEYFTFVHPDFKFDVGEKTLLENELKNSEKINDNWYYKKLKVCTNK
ncbi:MAG: hypothetical protein ACOYMD_04000 [Paludibacter sp.]